MASFKVDDTPHGHPMTPITEWLDAAQARCDAATEGPWRGHSFGLAGEDEPSSIVVHTGEFAWGDVYEGRFLFSTPGADSQEWDDADFVASARTDTPRLIAALRTVLAPHCLHDCSPEHGSWCSPCWSEGLCEGCSEDWPCPTVKGVAETLEVTL